MWYRDRWHSRLLGLLRSIRSPSGTFTHLSAGYNRGIDSSGTVQCWGSNADGSQSTPSGVFSDISAGENHTCALMYTGTVQCWGRNTHGQPVHPVVHLLKYRQVLIIHAVTEQWYGSMLGT